MLMGLKDRAFAKGEELKHKAVAKAEGLKDAAEDEINAAKQKMKQSSQTAY